MYHERVSWLRKGQLRVHRMREADQLFLLNGEQRHPPPFGWYLAAVSTHKALQEEQNEEHAVV